MMYRRNRYKKHYLLAGDCAAGRRLLLHLFGTTSDLGLNKRVNYEEGC